MRQDETRLRQTITDDTALDSRVTAALERRPTAAIPEDFAARVMARLPEKKPVRNFSAGRTIAYVCVAGIVLGLLLLTRLYPTAFEPGRSFGFGIEMLLIAELLGVGLWLGMWRDLEH